MSITIAARKAKARRLQQLVGKTISELTGIPFGKDKLIESREMGQAGVDVKLIGIALKIVQLSIECKFQESWSVHNWMDQAKENNIPNTDWILVAKRSRKDPVIFMDFKAFFKLFKIVIDKRIMDGNFESLIKALQDDEIEETAPLKPKLIKKPKSIVQLKKP